ncbi:MAG: serine/threonine-protein kinase [Victivallaceae bacterium]
MPEAADNKKRDDMDLSPENVEATQKIDINYSELALGKDAGRELADKIKEEHAVSSSSLLGKPVFSKKPLTDDYVKSASIVNAISSVPPLKDKLELLDIDSNYELKSELASGAQGIIRSAFDKSLQRDVVVKTLKTDEYEDDRSRGENLFVSEARIMAQLDHPSIIPLYGLHCGAENGLHLAMKHINGKTLREYLNDIVALYECENVDNFDEKRSIVKRIEYLIKVCEAVGYAHCKGVVHRDLKPENIMIGNYGEVYVMDWGLACLVHPGEKNGEEHEETQDYKNKLVGTPCYIAPEVIRGASCSPQSDIFSLGMILFEIVTLNRAVTGESVKEALTNIINSNYQPFRHRFLKTPLSPDLRAIVAKAICEPLSQRYKTAKDMADDLKLYLMREETSARPDNVVRKCVRGMINHKMITSIVILSILLCLAGAVIYSLYSRNVLITKQKARENMLAHFQYEASRKAYYMESIFFYFKNQLANVAHDAGKILNREPDSAVKVCSYEDFNRDSTAPGDYSYSPYYGIKVSLDRAVMKPGPGTALSDQLN